MPEYHDKTRYVCEIIGQGLGESSEKHTPYITFAIKPVEELVNGALLEPVAKSYRRDVYLYLTEKTQENTLRDLATLGLGDIYSFGQLEQGHAEHVSVVGHMAEFYCRHEEGRDGKVYEKWSVALPPRDGGGEREHAPIQRGQIRQLDSLFGLSKRKPLSRPAAVAAKPAVEDKFEADDDSIPF